MSSGKTMNNLKKQFECPICFETFERPKSLPCLHTFCEHCLDDVLQTQKSKKLPLTCPCCKKEFANISNVNDLPMNFMIQSTLDLIHGSKEFVDEHANPSICCGRCLEEEDEKNEAIQFCPDCQIALCDGHTAVHQKVKKTKEHVLVPVDQMPKESVQVPIKEPCPKHRGGKLELYVSAMS